MQLRRLKLSGPSGIPSKTEYIHYLPISPHISPYLPSGIPSKTEYILYASLSEWQQQQYKEILNKNLSTSDGKAATLNNLLISPHISPYLPISPQAVTLNNLLMQLRKCCNHPYLFEWPISDAGEEAAGEGAGSHPLSQQERSASRRGGGGRGAGAGVRQDAAARPADGEAHQEWAQGAPPQLES